MSKNLFYSFFALFIFVACEAPKPEAQVEVNPAAEGFNFEGSDAQAITVADQVMEAMGGRENWDNTKIISWTFFGNRTHTWDKSTGRNRIEIPRWNMIIDMNINSKEGSVWRNGVAITEQDSVNHFMQRGYEMWVNDSYWLVMPYKLKDTGVTLKYMGMDNDQNGKEAHKLQLTFNEVGVTPQNWYYVYVDAERNLVSQWEYYRDSTSAEPNITTPWGEWKQYGNIMLSAARGRRGLSNIQVMDAWPTFD